MDNMNCTVTGRIVYTIGDLFAGAEATDYTTKKPKFNKEGLKYREYGLGIAVRKEDIATSEIWPKIYEAANVLYAGKPIPANFKYKWVDGDTGVTQEGVPYNTKAGYPGHIVFSLKTLHAPKFYRYENGAYVQINSGIKCGDYVTVALNINGHTAANPSLFLNPNHILFVGYGEEIKNTPDAKSVFGGQAPAMPFGASATPIGGAAAQGFGQMAQAPAMPAQPQYQQAPAMPAQPQYQQAPAMPAQQYAPNVGVLPPHLQQAAQAPAMPPMPAQPQYQQQAPAMPAFGGQPPMPPNFR